ncbi:hypothetical protein WICPIJ_002211 [Wickerhamomyces pijperi]|uniref:ubiquitinyl hydrolase 1 n=1 Tax=Wickerhamomyces pijperi TaxID=599730 RepID=A0A9P8QCB9_WICPI|nr:hypothetical protein WICPIJ_002211 [Wickerhamomyces pijperi]
MDQDQDNNTNNNTIEVSGSKVLMLANEHSDGEPDLEFEDNVLTGVAECDGEKIVNQDDSKHNNNAISSDDEATDDEIHRQRLTLNPTANGVMSTELPAKVEEKPNDDGVPPLETQREIILQIVHDEAPKNKNGTVVKVISEAWILKFINGPFSNYTEAKQQLSAIDTSNILSSSGVFDFSSIRLTTIPTEAFEKLVQWYGLTSRSSPVDTHLISEEQEITETNENGEEVTVVRTVLTPEFCRPHFHLHHLTHTAAAAASDQHSRYNTSSRYSSVPDFTIPRLFTVGDLVDDAISLLYETESYNKAKDHHRNSKFRVWLVHTGDAHLQYNINPEEFHALPEKRLLKKDLCHYSLKDFGINGGTVVVEEKSETDKESTWPSLHFTEQTSAAWDGTVGLQNLGNTCFMNSALQCLVHIPELTEYFLLDCFQKELNVDNPLGMNGKIAEAFANLVHHLFEKKSHKVNSYTPRDFKYTIGHFNSMFSGYQQQDSQEFLAFLLDGLHEDLNRIFKKPITEKPELNDRDSITPENIKLLSEKSWEQHKLRNDSIIVDLFTGLYKSTLVCPECKKISITFDPFSDLTLPLPSESTWEGKLFLFLKSGSLKSFEVELPKTSTYATLKEYVATKLDLNVNDLFTGEIFNHQFYTNFDSSDSQSSYLPLSDLIGANDTIVMYEIPHNEGDLIVPVFNTYSVPNNSPSSFGVPFFITLNAEERQSFGTIRLKLEKKYEQLSTCEAFTEIRRDLSNPKKYSKKDFMKILAKKKSQRRKKMAEESNDEEKPEQEQPKDRIEDEDEDLDEDIDVDVDCDFDDQGYDSDVSLAHPEFPADYAFEIKVYESSRHSVRQPRRSFRSNNNRIMNLNSESTDKIWMPKTHNNFGKLAPLLDQIDKKKRFYYIFASLSDGELEGYFKEEKEEQEQKISPTTVKTDGNNFDDEEDLFGNNEPNLADLGESGFTDLLNFESTDTNPASTEEANDDVFETIEEDQEEQRQPIERVDLIKPGFALVCEWDPEEFEFLFTGLDESGGTNTWTNPESIPNVEVQESRAKREANKGQILSLDECLNLFSKPELLGEQDFWYCSQCKEHRQASKQIQIWSTPDILSIHLKRFENQRSFSDKIDSVVDFPIEGLDMKPYLASYEHVQEMVVDAESNEIYDLCAVDNHYGGLGGGHYTSYAKNFIDGQWYYYDDSRVSLTSPEKAITGAAYLLFYRKRSSKNLGGDKMGQLLKEAREQREHSQRQAHLEFLKFYEENKDSSDEDILGGNADVVVDDIEICTLEEYNEEEEEEEAYSTAKENTSNAELTASKSVGNVTAVSANPASSYSGSTVTAGYDSDDVESISVPIQGTSSTDENHRKLLKLTARSKTTEQFQLNGAGSDLETSAIPSPVSNISDEAS